MSTHQNILHIDDDRLVLAITEDQLTKLGFCCRTTNSPLEGIELATQQQFDAILIDGEMPELSGLQTLDRLRAHNPNCVAIMVTGSVTRDFIGIAKSHGAAEVIFKPVRDYGLLKESIETAITEASIATADAS